MSLPFEVDKDSPVPVYYQLKEQLALLIRNHTYPVGSQLPPETLISEDLGVSRGTVRQAISALVTEGRLRRVQGKGTFVTEPSSTLSLDANQLSSLSQEMWDSKIHFSIQLLDSKVISAKGRLLEKLGLRPGDQAIYLERLGMANNDPVVLSFSYLPEALCPGLVDLDVTGSSLFQLLEEEYGLRVARANRTLEVGRADEYEARRLGVDEGASIHFLHSLAYLDDGRPIEYARLRLRGDRSRFVYEVERSS